MLKWLVQPAFEGLSLNMARRVEGNGGRRNVPAYETITAGMVPRRGTANSPLSGLRTQRDRRWPKLEKAVRFYLA